MGAIEAFGKLNGRQREAAQFGPGPLLIIAGAGTGKTNTLAHRVAHLVLSGVAPERILLLTFSRRAAQEMIRRARRIVAQAVAAEKRVRSEFSENVDLTPFSEGRLAWAGTFHSIANRLLRRYAAHVGLEPAFSVIDRGDSGD